MAKDFSRTDRISEQILRELAEFIRLEVKDPRVSRGGGAPGSGPTQK
jgi:ribosome-binding factor A